MWALDEYYTLDLIKDHFANLKPLGKINKDIMKKFREYILVGGMPQAVCEYIKTKDFGRVDFIKQSIINLYENDIDTQEEENPVYVKNVFAHIPAELSKHDKQFVLSHIDNRARKREYEEPIKWLNDAMIINVAERVNEQSVAFNLTADNTSFKCYMGDTGLLISLAYKNKDYLENELYEAILFDKLHTNEGMIIENVVSQCLRANGHEVFFYKKTDKESKTTTIEIDFLIRIRNKVSPIEVKSSDRYTISSLMKFKNMYTNRIGTQYVLHNGDVKREGEIVYLPYYMAFCL